MEQKAVSSKNLTAKIAAAVLDVGGKLKADAHNKDQGYDYLSADKILSVGGQALANQGVTIIPQVTGSEMNLVETPSKKWRWDARLTMVMLVTDGESEILAPWAGYGSDYSVPDKAGYKAMTSGHKYFVMKLLLIGEGNEDGEHEDGEDRKPARQSAPAPLPARPAVTETVTQPASKQEAPANGNGHAPEEAPQPTRANAAIAPLANKAMIDKWQGLFEQAVSLGLKVDSITPGKITAAELAEKGAALRARIAEAESKINA